MKVLIPGKDWSMEVFCDRCGAKLLVDKSDLSRNTVGFRDFIVVECAECKTFFEVKDSPFDPCLLDYHCWVHNV